MGFAGCELDGRVELLVPAVEDLSCLLCKGVLGAVGAVGGGGRGWGCIGLRRLDGRFGLGR